MWALTGGLNGGGGGHASVGVVADGGGGEKMVVRRKMGQSQYVTQVTFQLRLLDLATCGRLLVITIK